MEGLQKRIFLFDNILKYSSEYFKDLEVILAKQAPDEIIAYDGVIDMIKKSRDIVAAAMESDYMSITPNVALVNVVINIFDTFDIITCKIVELTVIITNEKYINFALLGRSRTWSSALQHKRESVMHHFGLLEKLEKINNNELVELVYKQIKSDLSPDVIDTIIDAKSSNFITYMGKFILDDIQYSDKMRLIEKVNNKKDKVLGVVEPNFDGFTLPQRMISMRGLYPITQSAPVADCVKRLGGTFSKTKSDSDNLLALSDKDNGVIVINKSGYNVVEYDTQTLTDLKYVLENNTAVKSGAGINNIAVKRFQTIKKMDKGDKPTIGKEIVKSIGTQDRVYVFETIDGTNYRIIGDDFSNNTVHIKIASKLLTNISTRPLAYHAIAENIIVPRLDQTQERLDAYPAATKTRKTYGGIISQIIEILVGKFREYIKAAEVDDIESTLGVFKSQQEHIIRTTNYIIAKDLDLDKSNIEYRAIFFIAIHTLVFELKKKLQHTADHFSLPPLLFKESSAEEAYKFIVNKYSDILIGIYAELNEYPSVFDAFELQLKTYVYNKRVFLH